LQTQYYTDLQQEPLPELFALFGAVAATGAAVGKIMSCGTKLTKLVKTTTTVTRGLSGGMEGFDLLSMGVGLFDQDNALVHTAEGPKAIETIKAGDIVIATNPETGKTESKRVIETYTNKISELVKLTIGEEEIHTTPGHPFYVKDIGFVKAGMLKVGDKLVNQAGTIIEVYNKETEIFDTATMVHNFQVEDFHTYHVGSLGILVHNTCGDMVSLQDASNSNGLSNNAKPSQLARSWQGTGQYPGVDIYQVITLPKGNILFSGEPSGTEYLFLKYKN
jgi:hypothetical protein